MIFEKDNITFQILGVYSFNELNIDSYNSKRNFSAISFRISADSEFKTKNKNYSMQNGTVCFVPSNLNYRRIAKRDNMIVVNLNVENYYTNQIECFTANDPEKMLSLFEKLKKIWDDREIGYKQLATATVYEILAECYKQTHSRESDDEKIGASIDFLINNYKNPDITIKEIAERSHISEVYFRRLFGEKFGISPQKYIISLRIQNAASLINTGYYSLGEVASLSGYRDYKHFSCEFKRITGISPSKYKYNF